MSVKIKRFHDLKVFADILVDLTGQATTRGIVNTIKKRNKPRLTGDLMDEIKEERISAIKYDIISELPYSAAQEFGRPDLQKYTYTPYMEPGALNGTTASKMNTYTTDAANGAKVRSKI